MITFLNKKQVAFLLEIQVEDARAKMCVAWAEDKGIINKASWNEKDKIVDDYPAAMPVEILAKSFNIPNLQKLVDDVEMNYLKRPATRKWILSDYPEKELEKMDRLGVGKRVNIPAALRSMLPTEQVQLIKEEWRKRFPKMQIA